MLTPCSPYKMLFGSPENLSFVAILSLHFGKERGCTSGRSWLPDHTVQFVAAPNFVLQTVLEALMEVEETGEEYIGQT